MQLHGSVMQGLDFLTEFAGLCGSHTQDPYQQIEERGSRVTYHRATHTLGVVHRCLFGSYVTYVALNIVVAFHFLRSHLRASCVRCMPLMPSSG